MIFEWGINVHAAQTVRAAGFVLKDFELIAIVSVQPVLRSKPDEALIVLHYLGYPRLRQSILGGESRETHTISVNHRHGNCVRVDMRLRHGANIDWATVRQNNSVSGGSRCSTKQRCDKGAAERQAHDNRRRDRSLMDARSHGGLSILSGIPDPLFRFDHTQERQERLSVTHKGNRDLAGPGSAHLSNTVPNKWAAVENVLARDKVCACRNLSAVSSLSVVGV
jgi:hypothetical protein